MIDPGETDAYLDRIGATRPSTLDAPALADLQQRHLMTVPFENLSIHLGEPIRLDWPALFDKLVRRLRGGFCYELNGAFGILLTALGFRVIMLMARAFGHDGPGPPFDHLALRVDLDEPWLVDVGFGAFSIRPLRFVLDEPQPDPAGMFKMSAAGNGDTDVHLDGQPQYRLESRPRQLTDFAPMSWWQQHSPESHFRQSLVCTRVTATGRVTLTGTRLIETIGVERQERELGPDEVLDAYHSLFGVDLDRVPTVVA